MKAYKKGDIVLGTVTGIENYGAFVKIDEEHNGLIHISQISPFFIRNINDYFTIGEKIKAEVLEDTGNCNKIKLGIKSINNHGKIKKRPLIKETFSGFKTLKKMLNIWIETKVAEKILKK